MSTFTESELESVLRMVFEHPVTPYLAIDWRLLPQNRYAAEVAEIAERKIREGFGRRRAEITAMVDECNARYRQINRHTNPVIAG